MVTTPKPCPYERLRTRPGEHNEATCLCFKCKSARSRLRSLGHFAPEPGEPRKEYPDLESAIRELF
jgi:hypothetical protein